MNWATKKTAASFNPFWLAAVMVAGLFFGGCETQQSLSCSASTTTTTAAANCDINSDVDVDRP